MMAQLVHSYELSDDAEEDLREIARYTDHTWGRDQAERYRRRLEERFGAIANGSAHTQSFLSSKPDLRVSHCQRHYIFFLHDDAALPLIIAVLHDQMDLLTRLNCRLGE